MRQNKILLDLRQREVYGLERHWELIANLTTVSRNGGQLKLLNLTDKITDLR
jgi:hypothetical protein